MPKAVFTHSTTSRYDDEREVHYHFPRTYLRTVEAVVGDLIVYYEPRRSVQSDGKGGRQGYFAVARVASVEQDPHAPDHYYARLINYLDFIHLVPFREPSGHYYESILRKADGSTNKGAFGRSVRLIPEDEFDLILRQGFRHELEEWESRDAVAEPAMTYDRPMVESVLLRPFRDQAFRRHVREAYEKRCAVSGLRLINGGGRPEVQAAHIRPVSHEGPDSVRNGLALSGTFHWLFDRGLISIDENFRVLTSPHGVPDELDRLFLPDKKVILPKRLEERPHPSFLKWHRDHVFKAA
jgi:putative restriction endonuclease